LSAANGKLRDHAKNVANLSGKQASSRNIKKFISEQEQKLKQREVFDSLHDISSALDILNKVSNTAPAKNAGNLNVTDFDVTNSSLKISGYADKPAMITQLQNSLKGIAADSKVETQQYQGKMPAGQNGFQFTVKLARRAGG